VNDKDGVGDLVGIVDGGAIPVEVGRLWPWADEMIGVVTLEAGGVGAEGGEVCNAEPAGAGGEPVCGGERAQDGESARACAGNDGAVGVGVTSVGEERRDVDAVLYVQDAPVAVEVGAVGAAVAGATPVVDVDDGEAAAREELDAQFQPDTRVAGRTRVRLHDQRWSLPGWSSDGVVGRRVVGGVHCAAVAGRDLEALGNRDIAGVQVWIGVGEYLDTTIGQAQRDHRGAGGGACGDERELVAGRAQVRLDGGE
jgi:hypothetical protein